MHKYDIIYLQRFIPCYRVSVFKRLLNENKYKSIVLYGNDIENSKANNCKNLKNKNFKKFKMKAFLFFGRTFYYQKGLFSYLKFCSPKVIVCEAESHFLGYITAIFYKILINRDVRLLMWSFYRLPGNFSERSSVHYLIKKITRFFFHGFISYSTFGKNYLISEGKKSKDICVAINVCDTDKYISISNRLKINKINAKKKIHVGKKFLISYVGSLEKVKRPKLMLDIALQLDPRKFHINIIGKGSEYDFLKTSITKKNIKNVTLIGFAKHNLPILYRASDLVVVPGRGGIVISESMCFGIPVIVYQADGVEYDLVLNNKTGFKVSSSSAKNFSKKINEIYKKKYFLHKISVNAKNLIYKSHNIKSMTNAINTLIYKYI